MQFKEAEYEVDEADGQVRAIVYRSGDISQKSTVRCYTRQGSAQVMLDYNERPNTDASIITFLAGQQVSDSIHPLYVSTWCLAINWLPRFYRIGSRSSSTLSRIKWLLRTNEWINIYVTPFPSPESFHTVCIFMCLSVCRWEWEAMCGDFVGRFHSRGWWGVQASSGNAQKQVTIRSCTWGAEGNSRHHHRQERQWVH